MNATCPECGAPLAGAPCALCAQLAAARGDARRRFGRFLVLDELGRGGMGVVYRAWDERLRRAVALKMVLAQGSEDAIRRFQREAETVARLRHPHIVAVHEVGAVQGRHFIAMDFIPGATLERRIKADAAETLEGKPLRLSLTKALEALRNVARAVHHAHEQGVVHRDLKPANVLVDARGHAFVLDFGLARARGDATLTKPGGGAGTPAYMAPEQASGDGARADARSDVYSLGATLYFVLTGAPPFEGETDYNVLTQLLTKDPLPPRARNKRVAPDLETICLRALEKAPEKRYASAEDLARDLDLFLAGDAIEARPISRFERLARRARRNKPAAALALAVASLLVAAVAWSARESRRHAAELAQENERHAQENERHTQELERKNVALAEQVRLAEKAKRKAEVERALAYHRIAQSYATTARQRLAERAFIEAAANAAAAVRIEAPLDAAALEEADAALGRLEHATAMSDFRIVLANARQGAWRRPRALGRVVPHGTDVAVSPDGRRLASGDSDGGMLLWEADRWRALDPPRPGPSAGTASLTFSPDGKRLAGTTPDGWLFVWDAASGKLVGSTSARPGPLVGAWSPGGDLLAVGEGSSGKAGDVCTVALLAANDLAKRIVLPRENPGAEVDAIAWSPDAALLAASSSVGTVELWAGPGAGANAWRSLPSLALSRGRASLLAFSPGPGRERARLAVASTDGTVEVLDLDARTGASTAVARLDAHLGYVSSIAWSPDGARLATSGYDRAVVLWDVAAQAPLARLGLSGRASLAFLGADTLVLSAGEVYLWDVSAARPSLAAAAVALGRLSGSIDRLAVSPDGGSFATLRNDGTLDLFDASGTRRGSLPGRGSAGYGLAFSPEGRRLAFSTADGVLSVVDLETNTARGWTTPGASFVLRWSPDGTRIATGSQRIAGQDSLCIWDAATGRKLAGCAAFAADSPWALDWSPDGTRIAAACHTGGDAAKVWDAALARELVAVSLPFGPAWLAWGSRDRIAYVANTRAVELWEPGSGASYRIADPTLGAVASLAWSPDGRLVAAGHGTSVALLDAEDRVRLGSLAHPGAVLDATFSRDGKRLFVGTLDLRITTWDLEAIGADAPVDTVLAQTGYTLEATALTPGPHWPD